MPATNPVTLHGIRNCDTMKKARVWLESAGIAHGFHDYRMQGLPDGLLESWVARLGWEAMLNRAGTSFRKLAESQREALDAPRAIALMRAQPAMIRRPVLVAGPALLVGFRPAEYARLFGVTAPA
ncbi:ArsC family reductase [Falsiroseomonas selenitidurans]|uniref:ArsC family reductase n=1 Tax=Falsiroseomonas selenitidurans TaxID=2716335 RepID=A0ABX1EAC0_9PROT|nr:ArsC family reductase [Falsiroseomonas selenitidurans]NKC33778.1 ArsC family reductase [Falsiroseomonas selenitidurans]